MTPECRRCMTHHTDREPCRMVGIEGRLRARVERLAGAIEQHRRDYADAIGPQTKTRAEMNRKKADAAHRLWEAIGERAPAGRVPVITTPGSLIGADDPVWTEPSDA